MSHQQKPKKAQPNEPKPAQGSARDAIRAVESISWEIGDYFIDATHAVRALQAIQEAVVDCSPRTRLYEEVGSRHPGFIPLIRGIDIEKFSETGKISAPTRDPLQGSEDRIIASHERAPGKHKTLHDQYTKPKRHEGFELYIANRIKTITIGEVRKALSDIITNETLRADFMWQRLHEIKALYKNPSMEQVVDAVNTSLHAIDEAA